MTALAKLSLQALWHVAAQLQHSHDAFTPLSKLTLNHKMQHITPAPSQDFSSGYEFPFLCFQDKPVLSPPPFSFHALSFNLIQL